MPPLRSPSPIDLWQPATAGDTSPRRPSWITEERKDMLDKLNGIRLKGFQEIDATPTSAVTSLPTPHEEHTSLDERIQVTPSTPLSFVTVFDRRLQPPGAPLLKDYESFAEGTSQEGSFDSLPADTTNELGEPIVPITTSSVSLLSSQPTTLAIQEWANNVSLEGEHPPPETHSDSAPPAVKRRRSSDTDVEEAEERRSRPRVWLRQPCVSSPPPPPLSLGFGRQPIPLTTDTHNVPRRSHSTPPPGVIPPD